MAARGKDDVVISFRLNTGELDKGLKALKYGAVAALAAVGASAVYAVRKFQEFEQGLAGVQKVADFSKKGLGEFKKQIDELSKTIPISKTQLYETAEAAAVLGIRGSENLTKFAETMGRMAVATDLQGEDAAKAIARVIQLSGEAPSSIEQFGSALVELGNNFKASEAEILANATRIRQSTAAYDIASTEILAIATATKEAGIQAELAGTAVGRSMRAMDNAISYGGKSLKALEEIMGLTGDQIERVFRDSPAEAFKLFVEGLKNTNRPTAESGKLLKAMGLQGERIMQVLPSLAKNSDRLGDAFRTSNKAYRENNALVKESNAFFKTSVQRQALFKNKIDSLADAMGERLAPIWDDLLETTGNWIDSINNPETINSLANIVNFLGNASVMAGMLASNMAEWIGYISGEKTDLTKMHELQLRLREINNMLQSNEASGMAGIWGKRSKLIEERDDLIKQINNINEKIISKEKEKSEKIIEIEKGKINKIKEINAGTRGPSGATGAAGGDGGDATDTTNAEGMTWEEELEEFRLRNEDLTNLEDERNKNTIKKLRELDKEKEKLSEKQKQRLEADLALAKKYEHQKFITAVDFYGQRVGQFADSLRQMSQLSVKHGKEFFYLAQAASIAQTIMNTATGVMKAFADPTMGVVGSKFAAAAIVATGATQLATILAQKPPGMREGGIVGRMPGTPATGDRQMAFLEPGELVTPKRNAQDVIDMQARQQGSNTQDVDDDLEDENRSQQVVIGFEDDISDFVFAKRRMNQSLNIGVT